MRGPWDMFIYHDTQIFIAWYLINYQINDIFQKCISSVFVVLIMRPSLSHLSTSQSKFLWYNVESSYSDDSTLPTPFTEYFKRKLFGVLGLQSEVYKVNSTGELIQPWSTPTLVILQDENVLFTLTSWTLCEENKIPIKQYNN